MMKTGKQKIVFITTHNLATNPRLVKEIKLALSNHHEVEVICFIFRNWSYGFNEQLLTSFRNEGVVIHTIEAGKDDLKSWALSVGREKTGRFFSKLFSLKSKRLANAISRRNQLLSKAIKKIETADWVIGHNPGALWPTFVLGQQLKCKTGFDVEDYHAGEGTDSNMQKITKDLMQELLPQMTYVSFAAPLIMEAVKQDTGYQSGTWFSLLNYFLSSEFTTPVVAENSALQLVWFSHHINAGRGLEMLLPAIQEAGDAVELHLFGIADDLFKEQHIKQGSNIHVHAPLGQHELHQRLANYDVGLALEIPTDSNRNLCLTNKLLAYLQAGLFVIYTNTKAQDAIMQTKANSGLRLEIDTSDPGKLISELLVNKQSIRMDRLQRYRDNKSHNWEAESLQLLKVWKS